MMNPGTGRDDVRYFAVALLMAEHMEPGEEQRQFAQLALEKLTSAVYAEVRLRARCRDRDVAAATRHRSQW